MNIESAAVAGIAQRSASNESLQQASRAASNQGKAPATESASRVTDGSRLASDPQKAAQPSREELDNAVNRLGNFVAQNQSDINFSVDEQSGVRVVQVVDRSTQEIIRQMPSEEAVALARALDKLQGLLIKDKA